MTDLTEQWKKGELPEGHYYVKDGENIIAELFDGYFYNDGQPMTSFSGGVDEVLAPVPSYEEWKKAYECVVSENEEITTLKELLKKHRDIFARTLALCIDLNFGEKQKNQFADDIAKIDKALGEE